MPERADYPLKLRLTAEVSTLSHLKAAVCAGAHSVCLTYLGQTDKKGSELFHLAGLHDGVRFCHERGAQVYVCLRSHYSEAQIPLLVQTLTELNACGVDALRIGDSGTAHLVQKMMPRMPLHALNGVCPENEMTGFIADRLGFDRVCLGTCAELYRLKPHPGIAYEATAFSPGCGAVAGMCTLARFGTEGFDRQQPCSERCTLPHTGIGSTGYALCPKGVCLLEDPAKLPPLGVSSLYLDCRRLSQRETEGLVSLFKQALESPVGQSDIEKAARLLGVKQAGVGFLNEKTADALYTKEPPYRHTPTVLDRVKQAAARPYTPPTAKTVEVAFSVVARSGQPLTVTAMDRDGNPVCTEGGTLYNTDWHSGNEANLKTLMYQTGTTPYTCIAVKMTAEKGCRVDPDELTRLRDRALIQLSALRGDRVCTPVQTYAPEPFIPAAGAPCVAVQLSETGQLSRELMALDISCIYLPLGEAVSQDSGYRRLIADTKIELCPVLPQVPNGELIPNIKAQLALAAELGIQTVLCGDAAAASIAAAQGFRPRGDWSLWAGNTLSLQALKAFGFISCVVGFDTPISQLDSISHVMETELYAYGRLPLAVTPVCPFGKDSCPTGKCTIYNSRHEPYPVRRDCAGSRCTVYSAQKLVTGQPEKLMKLGADRVRLRFVNENARECCTFTKQFLENRLDLPNAYTTGQSEPSDKSRFARLWKGLSGK